MIDAPVLAHQVPENWRAQAEVFSEIFFVFLVIGTVVGVVVVAYTIYNGYKYRETDRAAGEESEGFDAPELGELPTGQSGGKSRKLFLSFGLSAIIVISLVVYSYGLLLYVEQGPSQEVQNNQTDSMVVNVTAYQFGWEFEYPNGHTTQNTLRVPKGKMVRLRVTSRDVWHAFGVNELRLKADAIPGQTDETWFLADEEGSYLVECFELCGVGHSTMTGEIIVLPEDEYQTWHQENAQGGSSGNQSQSGNQSGGGQGGAQPTPTPTPGGDH